MIETYEGPRIEKTRDAARPLRLVIYWSHLGRRRKGVIHMAAGADVKLALEALLEAANANPANDTELNF